MAERRRSSGGRSKSSGSKSSGSSSRSRKRESSSGEERIRGTAPSAPDIRKLELMEPSDEAKAHEPSTVDAMGQDKRRQVVGHSYGPTRRTQIMFFVAVGVAVVVLVGGWLSLVAIFDTPPNHFSDKAPWSTPAANAEAAAQQNTKPVSPDTACGEPGNQYPIPAQSPCAAPSKANDFQGSSAGE
ncbi:MAG: hypothetical protein ACJ75Z_05795 [Solirubrobacterales bacterium]